MMLRHGVELVDLDGDAVLHDRLNSLRLAIGADGAKLVRAFCAGRSEVLRVAAALFPDDDAAAQVDGFLEQLGALGMLEGSAALSPEAITQLRAAAREDERHSLLRAALTFARTHVPFHRVRMAKVDVDDVNVLAGLPRMSRGELRAGFPDRVVAEGIDLATELAAGRMTIGATSGTTDERVQVVSVAGAGAVTPQLVEFFGLGARQLTRGAVLTTPVCSGTACHLGDSTLQERTEGVTSFLTSSTDLMAMSDADVRRTVEELATAAPDVFFVHPWYAVYVGQRALLLGLSLPQIPLILTSFQYPTLRHRLLLHELYGSAVRSYYSATECGGYVMACECPQGRMHVREDHVHLEFAPSGRHVKGVELQHVLVTTLANRAMPLVNYAVGDIATADDAPCTCAWGPTWRTFTLEGRAKDVLFDTTGNVVTPRQVDAAIGDSDVDYYQLVQLSDVAFRLSVVLAAHAPSTDAVVARLAALLGSDAKVDVRIVKRLTPERSLKFRQTRIDGPVRHAPLDPLTDGQSAHRPRHGPPLAEAPGSLRTSA